jgi:hypothetical protein
VAAFLLCLLGGFDAAALGFLCRPLRALLRAALPDSPNNS